MHIILFFFSEFYIDPVESKNCRCPCSSLNLYFGHPFVIGTNSKDLGKISFVFDAFMSKSKTVLEYWQVLDWSLIVFQSEKKY
jgi:hypothetical protein